MLDKGFYSALQSGHVYFASVETEKIRWYVMRPQMTATHTTLRDFKGIEDRYEFHYLSPLELIKW